MFRSEYVFYQLGMWVGTYLKKNGYVGILVTTRFQFYKF